MGPPGPARMGGQRGGRVSLSLGGHSALTGRSASCSRPRRPSAPPEGPTSPSPCARARPCRCGRPRPRLSTTSPLSSRTRCPPTTDCAPPALACPEPAPGAPGGDVPPNLFWAPRSWGFLCVPFWLEESEEPPCLHRTAPHCGLTAGGVLLCSVEGAILNFIFITFFVDELKLCNLHLEC